MSERKSFGCDVLFSEELGGWEHAYVSYHCHRCGIMRWGYAIEFILDGWDWRGNQHAKWILCPKCGGK